MTPPPEATVEAVELLACWFCGRAPDESSRPSTKCADEIDGKVFFLSCKCGGFSARVHQFGHSRSEVVAKWNTRIAPTVSREGQREAIARIIEPAAFVGQPKSATWILHTQDRLAARAKADAILALPAPPQHGEDVA